MSAHSAHVAATARWPRACRAGEAAFVERLVEGGDVHLEAQPLARASDVSRGFERSPWRYLATRSGSERRTHQHLQQLRPPRRAGRQHLRRSRVSALADGGGAGARARCSAAPTGPRTTRLLFSSASWCASTMARERGAPAHWWCPRPAWDSAAAPPRLFAAWRRPRPRRLPLLRRRLLRRRLPRLRLRRLQLQVACRRRLPTR